jgi:hypothetical protein
MQRLANNKIDKQVQKARAADSLVAAADDGPHLK